jgi:hypothetical protein
MYAFCGLPSGVATLPMFAPKMTRSSSNRRPSRLSDFGTTLVSSPREFEFDFELWLIDAFVVHFQFDWLSEHEGQFPVVVDGRQFVVVAELFAERDQELTRLAGVQSEGFLEVSSRLNR